MKKSPSRFKNGLILIKKYTTSRKNELDNLLTSAFWEMG